MHVPVDVVASGRPLLFRCFCHMGDYGIGNDLLTEPHVTQIRYCQRLALNS